MDPSLNDNISFFILAGGESRRFGENKAFYPYHGKLLISWLLELMSFFSSRVFIIAKDKAMYEHLGYTVIEDSLPYQTPLVGIYTGLSFSRTPWNFFAGCDMPFLTKEVVQKLLLTIPETPSPLEIIAPSSPHGLEPVAALYHKSLAETIITEQDSIYSLKDFIRSRNSEIIEFTSSKPFTNVNYREQLSGVD